MAKISARGAVKLAEAQRDVAVTEAAISGVGNVVRTFFVLRSDGTVLGASSFPFHPGGSYDRKRSAYKAVARFQPEIIAQGREGMLAAFGRFAARKGAVLV